MKITKTLLLVFALLSSLNATCTKDEAYNKMMILGAEGAKRMHAYMKTGDSSKLIPDYVKEVSQYMKKEDYTKACEIYDRVAKENGISFKKKAGITMSMDEIRKDQSKADNTCSLTDATMRFLNVSNALLARGLTKTLEKDTTYHHASEEITRNPVKSCELTQKLADHYHVSQKVMMKKPQYNK